MNPARILNLRLGELFCGPGGIGLGASLARVPGAFVSHIWATDYDQSSCETYNNNLHPQIVVCEDIRKAKLEQFLKYGAINCLTFGFPCNDFSAVGERKGLDGTFGSLYKYCVKALNIFQPNYFIAENVSGIKNANEGRALNNILKELSNAGYILYPNLYCFEKYGVPQKRHRMIIVGIKKGLQTIFHIPSWYPYKDVDNTVKTALANIPLNVANNERTNQSSIVIERLKYIRQGENAFTADLPIHLRLNVKGAKISQIYKRLKEDEPAYTITGSGGGGTHVYHWSENRALTNRERARLQTFPDKYVFIGSKENVRKQIGMAVPPAGMKIIFEALLKSILGISYESMEANLRDVQTNT